MSKFNSILPGILVLAMMHAVRADVEIVKDGRASAEIVLSEKPLSSVKLAAADLQKYIELMSGAKLPIVKKPSAYVKSQIYVGESDYTRKLGVTAADLKVEGFKISARDNYVIVLGHDKQFAPFPYSQNTKGGLEEWDRFTGAKYAMPWGLTPGEYNGKLDILSLDATATLYGVSELLEQLGVRWYMPYENGTVVPEKRTVIIPEQDIRREPKFPYREFCYYGWRRTDTEGVMWFKRLKYGASYIYSNNHTTWDILTRPDQRKLHPEYYAMSGGKPIPGMGNRGVPRLSDPGFRETSVNYVNKVLEAYPELFTVSLGMPDGFTQIDETDAIKWNRPERGNDGKFSDYVWDYWFYAAKELKKSHPDKYLACLAYGTYSEPPLQIEKLPDNVAITLCYGTATLFLPDGKRRESLRSSWVSMLSSKKLYIWDYYLFYRTDSSPRYPVFFTKLLQKDMRNLNGICEGKFIEMAPVTKGPLAGRLACPGLTHLIYYLQGKLYWDPDLDMAKLLDEYYAVFFGPAKKEMREFYEFAEEVWMRPESRSISTVSGFLKEKDVDRYFDILKRARERAGKDNVYDKRIAQIETEMEPLKKLFPNLKRSGPEFRAITVSEPLKIDGDFNKPFWSWNMWYPMKDLVTGENLQNNQSSVSFRMTADKAALVIAVVCKESRMDKIVAKTSRDDDADIFNDDVVEVYIETPERSYFKIAVNANGAVWDESQDVTIINRDTLPGLWNPGIKVAVKKGGNSWNVEIMIPTKDLGSIGPTQDFPWGINVCRSRLAGGASELSAISPTSVPCFLELSKLGNLWIR